MSQPNDPDVLILERWTGPVAASDPHANFKREVAAGALVDPLPTLRNLASFVGLPVGAVGRHALVKWTTAGSDALLEVGPEWVRRLGSRWPGPRPSGRTGPASPPTGSSRP